MAQDELLYTGNRFRVVRRRQILRDGREHFRDVVLHPGAVAILPLLDDGRVVLIHNFRLTAGKTLLELPAGTLEPGEDPEHCARRELLEETGYRADHFERLAAFYPSPGVLDERMYLFLATGLHEGPMALEPGEEIALAPAAWDDALAMARDGRIEDAKTLAGLLYYHAFRRGTGEA